MKKIFFSLFALLLACSLPAQDLMDLMAEETCDCVSAKDLSNLDQEQLNMELGMCIMTSMSKHADRMEELNLDISDQESMNKFGEQVGMKMLLKCPEVLMKIGGMEVEQESAAPAATAMTGTVNRLEGEEFRFLILSDEQGREHRFLWLRYFPGSDQLINDPKGMIGKTVTLQYAEIECYSPKAGDYFNYREIKSIKYQP